MYMAKKAYESEEEAKNYTFQFQNAPINTKPEQLGNKYESDFQNIALANVISRDRMRSTQQSPYTHKLGFNERSSAFNEEVKSYMKENINVGENTAFSRQMSLSRVSQKSLKYNESYSFYQNLDHVTDDEKMQQVKSLQKLQKKKTLAAKQLLNKDTQHYKSGLVKDY